MAAHRPGLRAEAGGVCARGRVSRLLPAQPGTPAAHGWHLSFHRHPRRRTRRPRGAGELGGSTLARPRQSAGAPPLMILPCLNPWGLVNNQRTDQHGRDLNRLFDRANLAPIRELKRLLAGWQFDFGLSLHEDFDARGIYGYELQEGLAGSGGRGCSGRVPRSFPSTPPPHRRPGVHRRVDDPPPPAPAHPGTRRDDLSAPPKADEAHVHLRNAERVLPDPARASTRPAHRRMRETPARPRRLRA